MKYKFLYKPILFIINIITASFLVLKVDELQPSIKKDNDLKNKLHYFRSDSSKYNKRLIQLIEDYKMSKLDSNSFYTKLGLLLTEKEIGIY